MSLPNVSPSSAEDGSIEAESARELNVARVNSLRPLLRTAPLKHAERGLQRAAKLCESPSSAEDGSIEAGCAEGDWIVLIASPSSAEDGSIEASPSAISSAGLPSLRPLLRTAPLKPDQVVFV